jgi:hypothetical protein
MFPTLVAQFLALWFILEFALEIRDRAKTVRRETRSA